MSHKDERNMDDLSRELAAAFARWEYLYKNGGSDPFHPDGVNLFLVRNHILYYKRQMEDLIHQEEQTPTLFKTPFPDIYYRETPPAVSSNYMVKADEIRARATQQLTLYEQDPNFCFIRDHHNLLFKNGETKAAKAAGISPWATNLSRYRKALENDLLVELRAYFREPYEKKPPNGQHWQAKYRTFFMQNASRPLKRLLQMLFTIQLKKTQMICSPKKNLCRQKSMIFAL